MNSRIISNNLKYLLSILVYLALNIFCGNNNGTTVRPRDKDTTTFLKIESLQPYRLGNGAEVFSFYATGGSRYNSLNAKLVIYRHSISGTNSCKALERDITLQDLYNYENFISLTPNIDFTCPVTDDYYYIGLYTDAAPWVRCDWICISIGNPPMDLISTSVGVRRMNGFFDETIIDHALASTVYSFNPSIATDSLNVDINFLYRLALNTHNFESEGEDLKFLAKIIDEYTILNEIYRDTFRLCFVNDHNQTNNLLGLSNYFHDYGNSLGDTLSWSYIFGDKVLSNVIEYNFLPKSLLNQVTNHELIHQFAHIGNEEHTEHYGIDKLTCPLNSTTDTGTIGYNLKNPTFHWKICDRHENKLRGKLRENIPTLIGASNPFDYHTYSNDNYESKYSIQMQLEKSKYKELEPVYATFRIINNDNTPLKLFENFHPESIESNFIISDNLGNIWNKSQVSTHFNFAHLTPSNVIQPFDTLIISMPINNWGERLGNVKCISDRLFGYWGYFPANRKYKVMYSANGIESNLVEFETEPLNESELVFIDITSNLTVKQNQVFEQILDGSYLNEYLYASYIVLKHHKITYDSKSQYNQLVADYKDFVNEYPNSSYINCDAFIAPLIIKLFANKTNYSDNISYVLNSTSSDKLKSIFLNKNISSRIDNILNYYDRRKK